MRFEVAGSVRSYFAVLVVAGLLVGCGQTRRRGLIRICEIPGEVDLDSGGGFALRDWMGENIHNESIVRDYERIMLDRATRADELASLAHEEGISQCEFADVLARIDAEEEW